MIDKGRILPKDVIDIWPEVFGEVKLRVLPLRYLHAVLITFKDGKTWEVKITQEDQKRGWDSFESSLAELFKSYENRIDNVDFRLNTDKIKSDIEKSTRRFLKKKKL